MLNITLTITAAPELLGTLNSISKVFGGVSLKQPGEEFKELVEKNAPSPVIPQVPINPIPAPMQAPLANPMSTVQTPGVVPIQTTAPAQTTILNPVQPANIQVGVPTATQSYTMEQLAVAATQLVDAGRRTELVNLLSSFGVQALTALPKEQYGAFATQLRAMGAKL